MAIKYRSAKNKSDGKPKVVHLLSTKHNAAMKNTSKTDHDGNTIQKPDTIIYYSKNMGGVNKTDQQLDSITIIRKSFKGYHKVIFRLFSVAMLSSHKIYKEKGGKYDFLQFVHDIVLGLVENSPQLTGVARKNDNLVRLTGRHFPLQSVYQGEAKKRKHNPKMSRVCYAKGKRTEAGHIIRFTQYCEECPEKPGLCLREYFRIYHTKIDYTK